MRSLYWLKGIFRLLHRRVSTFYPLKQLRLPFLINLWPTFSYLCDGQSIKTTQIAPNSIKVVQLTNSDFLDSQFSLQNEQCMILFFQRRLRHDKASFNSMLHQMRSQCASLNLPTLYIMQDTYVRHLARLKVGFTNDSALTRKQAYSYKCIYLNPGFSSCFEVFQVKPNDLKAAVPKNAQQVVRLVRTARPIIDPSKEAIIANLAKINHTTVIKKCFMFGEAYSQCLASFQKSIHELISQRMFNDREDERSFMVVKLEENRLINILPKMSPSAKLVQDMLEQQMEPPKTTINNKEDIIVVANDIIGRHLKLLSQMPSMGRASSFDQMVSVLQPRVHIISNQSYSTDAAWLITVLMRNPEALCYSFSNHDPLTTSQHLQTANKYYFGKLIQNQVLVQYLTALRKMYPPQKLQLVIINTPSVSELLRHALVRSQSWWLFKLTSDTRYPKSELGPYRHDLSLTQNLKIFENRIHNFKNDSTVQMDLVQEISPTHLRQIGRGSGSHLVRLCRQRCFDWVPGFWIDTLTHILPYHDGDYLLKNGQLHPLAP